MQCIHAHTVTYIHVCIHTYQTANGSQRIHTCAHTYTHTHIRDLKPDNVLLTSGQTEEVKITDFGLACIVSANEAGMRAGTLTYSSPEKASAKSYSNKDDM